MTVTRHRMIFDYFSGCYRLSSITAPRQVLVLCFIVLLLLFLWANMVCIERQFVILLSRATFLIRIVDDNFAIFSPNLHKCEQ